MAEIRLLDQNTINQIAAGEVIERPSSVVKELAENAMDAGATAVTIEIRDGGISLIRVTDNGSGIPADQIRAAFMRHATSKIRRVEDLLSISSLGFRGEALSSIASVAKVELITRTPESLTGTRYVIEGGEERTLEDVGAPGGTTFLIRDLFYNTPARRKFLKTAVTEASYISALTEHLALSHPDVSFRLLINNQTKLHTAGNHNLKDIIYTIYGREITGGLIPIACDTEDIRIRGFVGKPEINRGNRSFETYFINGRYVRSSVITKALENAYHGFVMQHKYPFAVFHLDIDAAFLDVNVHPTKMEIRFRNEEEVYHTVYNCVRGALTGEELIPRGVFREEKPAEKGAPPGKERSPEIFEVNRLQQKEGRPAPSAQAAGQNPAAHQTGAQAAGQRSPSPGGSRKPEALREHIAFEPSTIEKMQQNLRNSLLANRKMQGEEEDIRAAEQPIRPAGDRGPGTESPAAKASPAPEIPVAVTDPQQMELFRDRILAPQARADYRLIGQLFDTYWLIQYKDQLLVMDQHAAHEKVLFERTMATLKNREHLSQQVQPPIIITLNAREQQVLEEYGEQFSRLGFTIEPFGGKEYAVYGVPANLFGIARQDLLIEMIDTLADEAGHTRMDLIEEKIALMSCKAAVKGNSHLSFREAEDLIDQLMKLENPYMCPHGRPTIITMTRYELEKKFKRVIS